MRRILHCFAVFLRTAAFVRAKEAAEEGGIREAQLIRYLQDAHIAVAQKDSCLCHDGAVNPFLRSNAAGLAHNGTKIACCEAHSLGIVRKFVMVATFLVYKLEETVEDALFARAGTGLLCQYIPRTRHRLPRRADGRRRSCYTTTVLGTHILCCSAGHHSIRHYPLHGRGRILRPHKHNGGQQDSCTRHAKAVERRVPTTRHGPRIHIPCTPSHAQQRLSRRDSPIQKE